jgi:hypothetical protein
LHATKLYGTHAIAAAHSIEWLSRQLTRPSLDGRCVQVCFALSNMWLGLDYLAEAYAMQLKAIDSSSPTSSHVSDDSNSAVLFDLLYASISLGMLPL